MSVNLENMKKFAHSLGNKCLMVRVKGTCKCVLLIINGQKRKGGKFFFSVWLSKSFGAILKNGMHIV